MQTKLIDLYYSDDFYETEEVYIKIEDDEISLYERTYERAPGGRYGIEHYLDKENTKKLLQSLSGGRDIKIEDCFKPFCGNDAAKKFKAYCETNSIEYKSCVLI